jgi:hypothetical protein
MKYNEILRLKVMMENGKIPFDFHELFGGYRIVYPEDGLNGICSVIEHDGSYGREQDLLEIMGLLTDKEKKHDDVLGYLTAENVFNRIYGHWISNGGKK